MKLFKKISALIGILIIIQCLTYFWIGLPTLKNKLLTGTFSNVINKHQDSLFVRDYYLSDCYTGDHHIYITNNLSDLSTILKEKFKTNQIYFDTSQNWLDTTYNKYNVAYFTYASRTSWTSLFDLFSAKQYETISVKGKTEFHKDATYQWFLFSWFKTYESKYS